MTAHSRRLRLGVFLDPPDETWHSMQLVGGELLAQLRASFAPEVDPRSFAVNLPRLARRIPRFGAKHAALNADRLAGRFAVYPAFAALRRRDADAFHVVDHSYAQIVHALPRARTGVFCHDLDAFKSLLAHGGTERPAWYRAMQRATLTGLQAAAVVFYTTSVVREQIEREGFLPSSRLVQAPYGIPEAFNAAPRDDDGAAEILAPLQGRRFLLHVGSSVPRKRLDVLFDVWGELRARHPELRFVQVGAALGDAQRAHIERAGIAPALLHLPRLEHARIAGLYRRAAGVLLTSESEGFGIPLVEALACGAVVFASDIPVLREVGGGNAVHCPLADVPAWAKAIERFLAGDLHAPPRESRLAHAARYSWRNHARTILDAYLSLPRP